MPNLATTRRRFVVAAITFSGLTTSTVGISVLRLAEAWAADHELDRDTLITMTRLARLLYPHDSITDGVYADVLDQALSETADSNGSFAATLSLAERALDALGDGEFFYLEEAAQIAALKAVEKQEFFAEIQQAVRFRLYNHPIVWEHLGYEGSSWEEGGYVERGALEIEWLPEA